MPRSSAGFLTVVSAVKLTGYRIACQASPRKLCLLALNLMTGTALAKASINSTDERHVMSIGFDKLLGIHAQALTLRSQRAEVIANNLANADTPNYLARDFDFKTALADAVGQGDLTATHSGHLRTGGGNPEDLLYQLPTQPAIDGNTVNEQQEIASFSDNALRYQASLRLLSNRFQSLLSAIKGE